MEEVEGKRRKGGEGQDEGLEEEEKEKEGSRGVIKREGRRVRRQMKGGGVKKVRGRRGSGGEILDRGEELRERQ